MAELSALRIAELSTLSKLAYSGQISEGIYGWKLLTQFSSTSDSGFSYSTFTRDKEIVIAFRGTDSISDISADLGFLSGSWTGQYEEAAKLVSKIQNEFLDFSITVTGHSLGGGIAQLMAAMYKLEGASFEAPGAKDITKTEGFRIAQQKYAGPSISDEPKNFINYTAKGSSISSVGTHVGEEIVIDPFSGNARITNAISILSIFIGGPVSFAGLAVLGVSTVQTHKVEGIERIFWTKNLLENEFSLETGSLVQINTRRSEVPELLALGGSPDDEVTLFKDRHTNVLRASLTKEDQGYVLRTSDMTEKVTFTQSADGAFDCKIERQGEPVVTCRARFGPAGDTKVEVDANNDGNYEQIIESGRAVDGMVSEKISYLSEDNTVLSSVEHRQSEDGLRKIDLFDRNGDGNVEERRTTWYDEIGNQTLEVENLDDTGEVSSEIRFRTDSTRQLTVYELIVNEQTEDLGFISQPVNDDLIARISSNIGLKIDLQRLNRFNSVLSETLKINPDNAPAIANELANQFVDVQLQDFLEKNDSESLGDYPALTPSTLLRAKIFNELLQFDKDASLDVRFNLDNDMLLISSDRLVQVRSDGTILRQIAEKGGGQSIVSIDADGFIGSVITIPVVQSVPSTTPVKYHFNYRNNANAQIEYTRLSDQSIQTSVALKSDSLSLTADYVDGKLLQIKNATIQGAMLSPSALNALTEQLGGLSADELYTAFSGRQNQEFIADSGDPLTQRLNVALDEATSNLILASDHLGNPTYFTQSAASLQTLTYSVSSLIDSLTLLNALKRGEPLPIVASGLRLAAGIDMLDGSRDLPGLGGAASIAGAILSLYGLAEALKQGDGVAAISSAAYATAGIAEAAALLQKAGLIDKVPASLSAAGSLNAALPYISLVNSLAHGDTTGVAVAMADITLMNTVASYTVPVIGWAYAIFSLVDALFTEVPDPWGNARFVWRKGVLAIDSAGETGGEQAVSNVMETLLASMNAMIELERQQNPGSQLGIIPNRMPGLIMTMDGYQFTDIDSLTGAERNPALRFDTNGRPYNAPIGSPESGMGLIEAMIRSGLAREAIAPLWEVRTAELQTLAGDPKAGLREEERAGIDGQLAVPVSGDTQIFRPVVLDLDGDGIDKIARSDGVLFDVDNTGFQKRTAWVGSDDTFLVIDRNYNGLIDSGREMFSNALVALGRRGLVGLAWTDANYDGRITADDPVWEEIRLWRDTNVNGQQDGGEILALNDLGVTELNYAMGTYTREGQKFEMSSPDLDADAQGIRINVVPQGVLIQASDDQQLSLLVTRIDDKTAVEPGRDGVAGIEDVEILIQSVDLLTNDLLGGFTGRTLTMESLTQFRHGTGFIDPNGIVHFQPEANYAGDDAGFSYIVRASNGQAGQGTVDISLAPINDAPGLGSVDQHTRPVYGYRDVHVERDILGDLFWSTPMYEPWTETTDSGEEILHEQPTAQEPTGHGQVIGSDIDDAASTLTYELVSQPQYGGVSLDASGAFSYISWKAPDTPSDRVLLNGQYAAWKDGTLYNASNIYGRAVYPTSDAFQVKVSDSHGASSIVTVTVPHIGPYLPPTPPGGGGKKPIAIDLDGDGFEFVNVDDSTIFYDVTGDGWKRRTSWIGKDDGILGYDIDGDGKIDKAGEIAFAPNADGAQTDLEGLAAFDSNHDGQFDANDHAWSRFGVWQDKNQDGITDAGEFNTLDQLGVQMVQLSSDGRFEVINGQTVHGVGKIFMKDGRTMAMADVTLSFSHESQLGDGTLVVPDSPFSPSGTSIEGSEDDDLILGNSGSDVIRTQHGDDVIIDDGGNDLIDAGAGNDTIFTGSDNDFVDAGAGDDFVNAGLGNDVVFGGDGNDAIFLQLGNDIAFGGQGNDLIAGEAGNDVLSGDNGDDQLFGGEGADALFGRDGNDQLYGMTGDDQLNGGGGNDLLDGGSGADSLTGGAGDDTYVIDDAADSVIEADDAGNDSGGHDKVSTTLDGYRLGDKLEDLELIDLPQSSLPQIGHGNETANHLTGNRAANRLFGYGGNDLIDGGADADLMAGGLGDDIYIVDHEEDRVIELDSEGSDTVRASISYTLPEAVEILELTGMKAINATGNRLDNEINGNAASNHLDGGLGEDLMSGGAGDDVYRVDNLKDRVIEHQGEGIDTVIASLDWALDQNIENLILDGSDKLQAFGNELDNLLRGNRGSNLLFAGAGNDLLIGAEGNDVLDGGDGNDSYLYQAGDGLDHIVDLSGRNRVRFGTGITADQVSIRVVDTGYGMQAQLRFLDANGDEDKRAGIDIDLRPKSGEPATSPVEEFEFADGRVLSFGDVLTRTRIQRAGPQEVKLSGDRSDDILYGNNRNNLLTGGSGNDAIFGSGGEDSLLGAGGNDFLAGGKKDDMIYTGTGYNVIAFNRNDGRDTVQTSTGAVNTLSLGQGISLSDLTLRRTGKDLVIDIGHKDGVTLKDWYASSSNQNLKTLQLIAPENGKARPSVIQMDFDSLTAQFDEVNGNRANSAWQVMKARLDNHLRSGTMAIGDELAFEYAQHGKFDLQATVMAAAMVRLDPAFAAQKLAGADSYRA